MSNVSTHRWCAAALALLLPSCLVAQGNTQPAESHARSTSAAHSIAVPSAQASRRPSPIAIDGKLDDAAWQAATPVTDFTQFDPDNGKPATQRTEVRFLFDDDALYVGAKMFDTQGAAGVRTRLVRRDGELSSDFFQVVIDGFHDHLSRAFFEINPSGSRRDQIGLGTDCCDDGWDPVWEAGTKIDADGWTAELRIPFNQLRFSSDSVQTWGLQIRRWIQRNNEQDDWSSWGRTENGGPSRFGHLEGLRIARGARHLELLPYVASKAQALQAAPGDPYNDGIKPSARVGLDLKYLLTPNLTLDATFNPDFGQVEVDPAVVNLSAFETSFDEKRPFFIEGSGVFGFGGFNCYFCSNVSSLSAFYSRRIGRSPSGAGLAYGSAKYVDMPETSTILGAAKITGRTSKGYTVGVLNAVTNQEFAKVQFANGSHGRQEVEPLSNYFVGRIKKDFLHGNLVVGGIATSVVRSLDTTFAKRLNDHSEFYGGDFRYSWKNKVYSLQGNAALSRIHGDSLAIFQRQLNSARYFQRPDRDQGSDGFLSNRLDVSATSMTGAGAYMRVGKDAGNWLWESAVNVRTPGFENNDIAFLQRADYVWHNANLFRNWTKPTKWYRQLALIGGAQEQFNFSGDVTDRQLHMYGQVTTPKFWNYNLFYIYHPELADDRLLRGGPMVKKPGTGFVAFNVNTDQRKQVVFNLNPSYSWNSDGGWGNSIGANVTYRPSSSTNIQIGPSWNDSRSLLQYVTSVTDPTATTFYGSRYILSGLRQKQLSLDTRLSMTFSPRMTLELYMQPFFASGHYLDFKEFTAPRQGQYAIFGRDRGVVTETKDELGRTTKYTIDPDGAGSAAPFNIGNPDFTQRSLRGNAVFRWEYHPGSVLYLAWTHSRFDQGTTGDLDFGRERQALWSAQPDNIFLIKASWWLAR